MARPTKPAARMADPGMGLDDVGIQDVGIQDIGIQDIPMHDVALDDVTNWPGDDFAGSDAAPRPLLDPERRRGRGSARNQSGRFETETRVEEDDGWGVMAEAPPVRTTVTDERARTIISTNASPDLGFDRSINPYRGCEHGCVYCFARPTHAYMGLSPGLDFETRLFAKPDAAALLERELAAPSYRPKVMALGTNTDPYQPIERERRITRQVLEVLERTGHPVGIVTKSALVTRDIDILSRMASRGLARVALSVTTLDTKLARALEPRAATPPRRLDALRQLSEAGIPTTIMTAPIIPGITDHEMERLLEAGHAAGVTGAGYVMLRLPLELRDLIRDWLVEHRPERLRHVMSLVQSTRGGKDYDASWGQRQTGTGPYAALIARRFEIATVRLGLDAARPRLRTDLFVPPPKRSGRGGEQLSLL